MRTTKKTISTLLAAAFVSTAFVGGALASDPDDTVGDLNGDRVLSIRQMQEFNAKALRSAGNLKVIKSQDINTRRALADFPDQAVGDLSGDVPIAVRQQANYNSRAGSKNLLILPFFGDWNGSAKPGFAHK